MSDLSLRTRLALFLMETYLMIVESIEFYFIWFMFALPNSMYGAPVKRIHQLSSSDIDADTSDDELTTVEYDLVIESMIFIIASDPKPQIINVHGAKLFPLVSRCGRFYLPVLRQFFPQLDTIRIEYSKTPVGSFGSQRGVKVLDVKRRFDLRNVESVKMGVVF